MAITNDPLDADYPDVLQAMTVPIGNQADYNRAAEAIGRKDKIKMKDFVSNTNICTDPLTGGFSACDVSNDNLLTSYK